MDSKGKDRKSVNRAIRQEELRLKLQAGGHLQHVIENVKKLQDLNIDMDNVAVRRLDVANNAHLKLIGKYLPDLKSTELTGEGGGALEHVAKFVINGKTPDFDAD